MPTLALRGLTIYPKMMVHFDVGREASIKAIEEAMSSNTSIFLVAQKDIRVEVPDRNHLFDIGTVSTVRQILRLPAGRYRTLRVTLGEGAGKNWWCVVFPSLCLPAATQEEALLTLPEGERQVVEGGQDVQVKLKAVELWESLREWLRG